MKYKYRCDFCLADGITLYALSDTRCRTCENGMTIGEQSKL